MTSRYTTSDTATSAPHTPSSLSVVTGLKASLGTGPFFHAHLQEGLRIEDDPPSAVRYEVSAYAISPKGIVTSGKFPQKSKAGVNVREETPQVSQRHAGETSSLGAQAVSSSTLTMPVPVAGVHQQALLSRTSARKCTRSASATAMSSDPTEFWRAVRETQTAMNGGTPVSRRNHYITRSQSASAAADAGHLQQAPKMRKQNASYSPGFGTPAYHETVENTPVAPNSTLRWCPTRGRFLSPIEELFPEKQGDAASLHSTTSAQSNLFIHRSVRRTPSASTLNSGYSVSRSPDDPNVPHSTSPSRSYGPSRTVVALPVIPASPRESQNVFEQDPISLEEASKAYPMPVVYPRPEYSEYQQQEEQDLGETLSTLRFAVPRHLTDRNVLEEEDLGDGWPSRNSYPHSQTPSLLARSESVRTELTYLTAQDSAPNSRRASYVSPGELEGGRRHRLQSTDADTTLVNTSSKPSPVARLKASIDTLLSKSPKMRKSPGGINNSPTVDASSTLSVPLKLAKVLSEMKLLSEQMKEEVKKGAPWSEGEGKQPAKVLFWTGFLAPWCWLIGGWMLARSGETMAEGLPRGAKEPELPLHNTSGLQLQLRQQRSREIRNAPDTEKQSSEQQHSSIWQAAKNSSVELLDSLRGLPRRADQEGNVNADKSVMSSKSTVRAVVLHGDVPIPILITPRVDPWVTRCRVAAVVSGMFILALCIVALVVLVRAL
ncbi:hypothetical protein A7U60_g4594 [Sanghuangporus baumii]|uniref:Uncharacterized protein n=1 Tax=Sanghuangporus baumii TaxID=108892 RepID=A0A9Q5N506_SANBA|nr:hypothetical protein A7U60_g4594 [Sanghuangporus baumii]